MSDKQTAEVLNYYVIYDYVIDELTIFEKYTIHKLTETSTCNTSDKHFRSRAWRRKIISRNT
jgi:hypothetical protein